MKLFAPKYYKDFKCIADKCEHNCCTGWQIDVDTATLKKYKELNGGYGEVIKRSISKGKTPHFITEKDERCPHLDERGLCRIITSFGEEYLCDICKNHPRFYNYTDVCEVGIGMSCPEAARIILASDEYTTFCEVGEIEADLGAPEFDGRTERNEFFKILSDKDRPFPEKLDCIYEKYGVTKREDAYWLDLLDSIEYLDESHKDLFMHYSGEHEKEAKEPFAERFLAYLVYRHCTEAQSREDFSMRLGFCLFCHRLLTSLTYSKKAKTHNEIAHLASIISEEIEYSEDNTFALMY